MSNYINQVSDSLKNHISELANNPCLFLRNPNVDFSRKRKIDFKTFIGIMMNSGGATMSKELLDFFDFNKNTPSVSAFTQQRSKVLPEAFEYLFKSFTDDNLPTTNNYHGYRLIACDGSNLTIATNQKDPETFWERNQHGSIVNKLHLNAFYDVLNRIYTDVLVQTAADYNEFRACATMIDRSKLENVILVADRGYENYNIFAHAIEKGWKFAIRVKDKNSNGIVSGLNLPPNDEFDIDITQIFSRKNTKTTKNAGYKWMPVNQVFDYLPRKSDKTKQVNFTIAIYICREGRMKKLSFFHTPFFLIAYSDYRRFRDMPHCDTDRYRLSVNNIISSRSIRNHGDRESNLLFDELHIFTAVLRKILVILDSTDITFPSR